MNNNNNENIENMENLIESNNFSNDFQKNLYMAIQTKTILLEILI